MSFLTRFPFLCFMILILGTLLPLSGAHAALAPEIAPPAKKVKKKYKKQKHNAARSFD